MRRSSVGILGTAALLGGLACAPAFGAPTAQSLGLRTVEDGQNPIQQVQYSWNGYDYCWYDYGWQGPGWYVCEYGPYVTGYWWGGPLGWHGWRVGRGERFERREGRFEGREGRTFGPGTARGFSAPSTEGRSFANGPGRFEGTQGMNRSGPAPGPGLAGPGTVGRGGGPSAPVGGGPGAGGGRHH
jgi:hypothetical protein